MHRTSSSRSTSTSFAPFHKTGAQLTFFAYFTRRCSRDTGIWPYDEGVVQANPALCDVDMASLAAARPRTGIKMGFYLSADDALCRLDERDAAVAARVAAHGRGRGRGRGRGSGRRRSDSSEHPRSRSPRQVRPPPFTFFRAKVKFNF